MNLKPLINRLPEPLYTVAYFALKIELVAGALFLYYTAVRYLGMTPGWKGITWSFFGAYWPFVSYFFYFHDRKEYKLTSHYLVPFYAPIVMLPLLAVMVMALFIPSDITVTTLVIGACLLHYIGAAASAKHGISLFPFEYHFALQPKPNLVSQKEYTRLENEFIEQYRTDHGGRDPWDRTWREELQDRKSDTSVLAIFFLLAVIRLVWMVS